MDHTVVTPFPPVRILWRANNSSRLTSYDHEGHTGALPLQVSGSRDRQGTANPTQVAGHGAATAAGSASPCSLTRNGSRRAGDDADASDARLPHGGRRPRRSGRVPSNGSRVPVIVVPGSHRAVVRVPCARRPVSRRVRGDCTTTIGVHTSRGPVMTASMDLPWSQCAPSRSRAPGRCARQRWNYQHH